MTVIVGPSEFSVTLPGPTTAGFRPEVTLLSFPAARGRGLFGLLDFARERERDRHQIESYADKTESTQ